MGLPEIIGIINIILLFIVIILQLIGRRKSNIGEIITIMKHTAEEQRDSVQKQIAGGATEQFERFGVIQNSIQETLSSNREEVSRQLYEFRRQMETKLMDIQNAGTESNERIGLNVTAALKTSREEQYNQLSTFSEQVDGRLSSIQNANVQNIDKINATLESKMKALQERNEKRLEQMQNVVDEKLQKTLETRLAMSFELVSKQLESVGDRKSVV